MAVEMITMHWCDVCKKRDDVKREASTRLDVKLSEVARHVDLCEDHAIEPVTFATLSAFLTEFGTALPSAKR